MKFDCIDVAHGRNNFTLYQEQTGDPLSGKATIRVSAIGVKFEGPAMFDTMAEVETLVELLRHCNNQIISYTFALCPLDFSYEPACVKRHMLQIGANDYRVLVERE